MEILEGKNPEQDIVGIDAERNGKVLLYYKDGTSKVDKVSPFIYLKRKIADNPDVMVSELNGEGHYKYIAVFKTMQSYYTKLKYLNNTYGWDSDEFYVVKDITRQYLIQSGKTMFKGMVFSDLNRVQLDIETYGFTGFPDPEKKADEIFCIQIKNGENIHVLQSILPDCEDISGCEYFDNEPDLLRRFIYLIQEIDPDTIEGHNIYAFDLPYIITRCDRYDIPLEIGRGKKIPHSKKGRFRVAERMLDLDKITIPGRSIVDTYFLVMLYDVFKRDMPSHGLKQSAIYFGFADEDREYIQGDKIQELAKSDPRRVIEYAIDDVVETDHLCNTLGKSSFYLTKMLPDTFQGNMLSGNGVKIESLFLREYLRHRHALPKRGESKKFQGALSEALQVGVFGPVVYADVASLYPSIMLNYDIQPKSDTLQIFQPLLKSLTDMRLKTKAESGEAKKNGDDTLHSELFAREQSYKIVINSFYGVLGFQYFMFNDYDEAERVTAIGREILLLMTKTIEDRGGLVINMDTDGAVFVPPDTVHVGPEPVEGKIWDVDFVRSITEAMPTGISIDFDGRYKQILCYKAKNYALLDHDDKVKYKGSAFKSRSMVPFGKTFIGATIHNILHKEHSSITSDYRRLYHRIINMKMGIDEIKRNDRLNDSLEEYKKKVELGAGNGGRARSAHYELGLKHGLNKGDRVEYYISTHGKGSYHSARLASEFNNDYSVKEYLKIFNSVTERFQPFFGGEEFRQVFSKQDDLLTGLFK